MRAKSLVLIMIALGCGLIASIGISQVLEGRGGGSSSGETVDICVTNADVDIGEPLTEDKIVLEAWPKDRVPEGAISDAKEVAGRRPKQRLYAGEAILEKKLIDGNSLGGASERIPPGFCVATVTVERRDVAGGLLLPGDHVDVLVYLRKGSDVRHTHAKRVLKNVRVFAVNEHTERHMDEEGNVINAKTVSLLVEPGQDALLLMASEQGKLSLSMRRVFDDEAESVAEVSMEDLIGESVATRVEPDPQPAKVDDTPSRPDSREHEKRGGFLGFLNGVAAARQQASALAPSMQVAASGDPTVVMDIVEPGQVRRYEIDGDGNWPREVPLSDKRRKRVERAPADVAAPASESAPTQPPLAPSPDDASGARSDFSEDFNDDASMIEEAVSD